MPHGWQKKKKKTSETFKFHSQQQQSPNLGRGLYSRHARQVQRSWAPENQHWLTQLTQHATHENKINFYLWKITLSLPGVFWKPHQTNEEIQYCKWLPFLRRQLKLWRKMFSKHLVSSNSTAHSAPHKMSSHYAPKAPRSARKLSLAAKIWGWGALYREYLFFARTALTNLNTHVSRANELRLVCVMGRPNDCMVSTRVAYLDD